MGGRFRVTGGKDDGGSIRSEVMSFHLKVTLLQICTLVIIVVALEMLVSCSSLDNHVET